MTTSTLPAKQRKLLFNQAEALLSGLHAQYQHLRATQPSTFVYTPEYAKLYRIMGKAQDRHFRRYLLHFYNHA